MRRIHARTYIDYLVDFRLTAQEQPTTRAIKGESYKSPNSGVFRNLDLNYFISK